MQNLCSGGKEVGPPAANLALEACLGNTANAAFLT